MNLIYNKNKQGKIEFLSTIKRSYCPVTISPFRVLNRVSVWAVKVDEEQSIVTFLIPTIFFMFLSLDFKIRSLGLKRVLR